MVKETNLNIRFYIAVALTIVGCGLLIAGFIVPPLGIIHSSVLVAFGEASTFVGAILGIDYTYKYRVYRDNLIHKIRRDLDVDEIM